MGGVIVEWRTQSDRVVHVEVLAAINVMLTGGVGLYITVIEKAGNGDVVNYGQSIRDGIAKRRL